MLKRKTIRQFAALTICSAILMGALVFHVKYQVIAVKRNLLRVNRALLENAEAQQVLKAEWEYLNKSSRLKKLNQKYVGLQPVEMAQIASLRDFDNTERHDMKIMLASLN